MPKLLSLLFWMIKRITPAEWLVAIILLWWGYVRHTYDGLGAASFHYTAAGLIALLSLWGRATQYMLFWPAELAFRAAPAHLPLRGVVQGYASGDIRTKNRNLSDLEVEAHALNLPVQVRWLDGITPPRLAALTPADLTSASALPHLEAETWSLWYPGSEVRTGWVYAAGQKRFGLEISYLGRRLLLAFDEGDEEAVDQILGTIKSA